MNNIRRTTLSILLVLCLIASARAEIVKQSCTGDFPNFVTDVCWSCMFPMRLGGAAITGIGNQEEENFDASSSTLCTCASPPRVGVSISFYEPVRLLEVVKSPMCFPTLGGIQMPNPVGAPNGQRQSIDRYGFYHAHWYNDSLLSLLEVLLDFEVCLEDTGFDIAYMTELDPLWSDAELTRILNPDVFLFANPLAQAACAADCIAASAGFPLSELFWCAGCQGSMYPLTGQISHSQGGVAASALIAQRMSAKLHRELLVWATWGETGQCNVYPQPLMDKRAYKFQMISPPNTTKIDGRCCTPFGRSHMIWGLGKELPFGQSDFVYQIFRKRQCCFNLLGIAAEVLP